MSSPTKYARPVSAFVALALAMTLSSCARTAPPALTTAEKTVDAMDPMRARSVIASSFPLEVPVPSGTVVAGKAQGGDSWDYEIEVDAPPEALAEWFRNAFSSRSWSIVDDTVNESAGGGLDTVLVLRKGAAESRVAIQPDGDGSRAVVVLGVGAPVLMTQ